MTMRSSPEQNLAGERETQDPPKTVRTLLGIASISCVIIAAISWPTILASLATADGSIDSEFQRIVLKVVSVTFLSAGIILALPVWFASGKFRCRRVLVHTASAIVVTPLLCVLLISLSIYRTSYRTSRMDPTEYVVSEHQLATSIAAARKRGGDEAAWSTTAEWFMERSQPVLIPPYQVWSTPTLKTIEALRCIVDGNLGCLVNPPKAVPWQPGQPLRFRSPPVPRDVLFRLQKQSFLLKLLQPPMSNDSLRSLDFAQGILKAWQSDSPAWPETGDYRWGDDPMANRIQAHMAVMHASRQKGGVSVKNEIAFLRSLLQHAERLMDEDQHNFVTNHGMMQNAALLNIAVQYPEFDTDGRWQKTAAERMWRSVDEHVGDDGVFLELTPAYHGSALKILLWFRQQSLAANIDMPSTVDSKLRSMVEFLIEILQPDHAFPLIADTSEALFDPSGWPWAKLPDWSQLQTLKRLSTDRSVPPNKPGARYWPDSGYFVLRAPAPTWTRQEGMHATLMLGKESHAHRHANKMSLTWFGTGQPLLQGPGYPSYFDMSERIRLIGTSSQNAVTVDGRSQEYGDVETVFVMRNNGPISSNLMDSTNGLVAIQGLSRLYSGVAHRRTLIYGPQVGEIMLLDELNSNTSHTYRQHFNPANGVSIASSSGDLKLILDESEVVLARIQSWTIDDGTELRPDPDPEIHERNATISVTARSVLLITRLQLEGIGTKSEIEINAGDIHWRGDLGSATLTLPVRAPNDLQWRSGSVD